MERNREMERKREKLQKERKITERERERKVGNELDRFFKFERFDNIPITYLCDIKFLNDLKYRRIVRWIH